MYKNFTLATVVAIIPVTRQNLPANFNSADHVITVPSFLNFKNATKANPFQREKKSTETWSQNWQATAQENIRKSEYHFKWKKKLNACCSPNRENNLRFYHTNKGFSVEPRTTQIPIRDNHIQRRAIGN